MQKSLMRFVTADLKPATKDDSERGLRRRASTVNGNLWDFLLVRTHHRMYLEKCDRQLLLTARLKLDTV